MAGRIAAHAADIAKKIPHACGLDDAMGDGAGGELFDVRQVLRRPQYEQGSQQYIDIL